MFDKYSFKEPENTNNLANDEKCMKNDPKINQKTQEKHQKIIKNNEKSTKITSGKASGPCKASKWAKMALKEVGNRILGVPWDFLGNPKIIRKSKK